MHYNGKGIEPVEKGNNTFNTKDSLDLGERKPALSRQLGNTSPGKKSFLQRRDFHWQTLI